MKKIWSRWRWGLLAAVLWACLAAAPQVYLRANAGGNYNGSYALSALDEVAYMAYARALSEGRPRRNDPQTGRDETSAGPQAESLFSVQFIPPYLVAGPARVLGLSVETAFILVSVLAAGLAALAIFWLARAVTGDEKAAFAAPFVVLGLGTMAAAQGALRHFLTLPYLIPLPVSEYFKSVSCYHLPFLRLYQPGVGFPLFFVVCGLAWRALTHEQESKSRRYALASGAGFAALVFCYFFLWTAAAAWLVGAAWLWFITRPAARGRGARVFGVIGAGAALALGPYFWLLSRRAATTDNVQLLKFTRQPELWRGPEIVAALALAFIAWGLWRGRLRWRDDAVLFAVTLALLPFAVLNQQAVTGRLLQPFHYQWYIANYVAVLAALLTAWLWWREGGSALLHKRLLACALAAFGWGACEVWLSAGLTLEYNQRIDAARPVLQALAAELEATKIIRPGDANPRPLVLIDDLGLADRAPAQIPQASLWTPHLLVFPTTSPEEARARFWLQLYLAGYGKKEFDEALENDGWNFFAGLFDYEKLSPALGEKGVTKEDIEQKRKEYAAFTANITARQVGQYPLSYLVVRADKLPDFSNFDRWYERGAGEPAGGYLLYRVTLKAATK